MSSIFLLLACMAIGLLVLFFIFGVPLLLGFVVQCIVQLVVGRECVFRLGLSSETIFFCTCF